ncbi:hypothetical protein [Niabella ginsengisoli]|uniref:Dialkylresorcinol condensing enzyme DarA n=1 Tax=Niabella ginsengisoli TaxID=522298 RepID=A0ABS9SNT9_9BACT|nr:hypothetical protein [Niabella ginsengisoli]MCH5600068.1 hypothetical protein [Niabella ginsengisoli]
MKKRILAVYFSQSGQTKTIVDNFIKPIAADGNDVEYLQIKPVHQFPFPWTIPVFFDTVPESVEVIPTPLQPWKTDFEKYDLVVLGWQPWNLSPSIPFSSILQDEKFKSLIKDTPVITISGCRNMWINAQEKNKKLLKAAGAMLVGNIALVDRHPNHLSYFTIFHWLGTGRKDRKWGVFPRPGVSEKDISGASKFGDVTKEYLREGKWDGLQQDLVKMGAAPVKYSLMFIEKKAGKIFQKWVDIINKFPQKRKNILVAYKYYLAVALLVASPVILAVDFVLFRPFSQRKIKRQMEYYRSVDFREII